MKRFVEVGGIEAFIQRASASVNLNVLRYNEFASIEANSRAREREWQKQMGETNEIYISNELKSQCFPFICLYY